MSSLNNTTYATLMDPFDPASPTNLTFSPSPIVGEFSTTMYDSTEGIDSLFPRPPEGPEDEDRDSGTHYGTTSQCRYWAMDDLDGEMGPTDEEAIKKLEWPRRVEAAMESHTPGDGVCTLLYFLLVTTVDLHDFIEPGWWHYPTTRRRRAGDRPPGRVGRIGRAGTECGTYRHAS